MALSMRGYGESEKPEKISDYDLILLTEDVKSAVDFLSKKYNKKPLLIGHDWGAVVGWSFARKYTPLLKGYISLSIPPLPMFEENMSFN